MKPGRSYRVAEMKLEMEITGQWLGYALRAERAQRNVPKKSTAPIAFDRFKGKCVGNNYEERKSPTGEVYYVPTPCGRPVEKGWTCADHQLVRPLNAMDPVKLKELNKGDFGHGGWQRRNQDEVERGKVRGEFFPSRYGVGLLTEEENDEFEGDEQFAE